MFTSLPIWAFCLLTAALVFAATEFGFLLARMRGASGDAVGTPRVDSVIGALLGLLALLLAFTFHLASSRFDERKRLVQSEANAIGTTFLHVDFLPEPQRGEMKQLLREYVASRIGVQTANVAQRMHEADQLHARMWAIAAALPQSGMALPLVPLFASSLNEVIDLHSDRVVVGLQYRVPDAIWLGLALLLCLSMFGVGVQFGFAGRRNVGVQLVIALAFSIVVWLIVDLDRPGEGLLSVSQQPLLDLQQQIGAPRR
jgi:hypothetical protein